MNADIIFCVLDKLEPHDVIKCSTINKEFYAISKNELIWKRLFDKEFIGSGITRSYYINYRLRHKTKKVIAYMDRYHGWYSRTYYD
jgi:hypothetical protein